MTIFSHITLGVNNLDASIAFYDGVMGVLGYERHSTGDSFAGYGPRDGSQFGTNSLWILTPSDGEPASGANGTNIALHAPDRQAVRDFHRVAVELGGRDDGEPGVRADVHPNFYAGYIYDLDGNKLVIVCHYGEDA
ncbi:MAG: VOC family protein [Woeseiaceae bacterium]|nr:VOC family protein [Woeseiaceae bacterium]